MQNYSSKFKNSDIKKRTKDFALDIIKFIDHLDKKDYTISVISKQLIRSATSIGANVIEAQACSTRKDFIHFLTHALKSANETKFWLELLNNSGKSDKKSTEDLLDESVQLANILGASILKLKSKS